MRLQSLEDSGENDATSEAQSAPHSGVDALPGGIPPETWSLLSQAGHSAAQRLVDLLDGKAWARLKTSDQIRLLELALNRAYGPPIKRAATLELRGTVSDAVADSLARLSSADLPENGGKRSDMRGQDAPSTPAPTETSRPASNAPQSRLGRRNVKRTI